MPNRHFAIVKAGLVICVLGLLGVFGVLLSDTLSTNQSLTTFLCIVLPPLTGALVYECWQTIRHTKKNKPEKETND